MKKERMIVLTTMIEHPRIKTVGMKSVSWNGIAGSRTLPATTESVSLTAGMKMKNDITMSMRNGVSILPIGTSGASDGWAISHFDERS
tara:strand:+ start:265 stop:528 length:264 start_codon:yes stop_codon:yes gene_type:complete